MIKRKNAWMKFDTYDLLLLLKRPILLDTSERGTDRKRHVL